MSENDQKGFNDTYCRRDSVEQRVSGSLRVDIVPDMAPRLISHWSPCAANKA